MQCFDVLWTREVRHIFTIRSQADCILCRLYMNCIKNSFFGIQSAIGPVLPVPRACHGLPVLASRPQVRYYLITRLLSSMVEYWFCKPNVIGSSPIVGYIFSDAPHVYVFLFFRGKLCYKHHKLVCVYPSTHKRVVYLLCT